MFLYSRLWVKELPAYILPLFAVLLSQTNQHFSFSNSFLLPASQRISDSTCQCFRMFMTSLAEDFSKRERSMRTSLIDSDQGTAGANRPTHCSPIDGKDTTPNTFHHHVLAHLSSARFNPPPCRIQSSECFRCKWIDGH